MHEKRFVLHASLIRDSMDGKGNLLRGIGKARKRTTILLVSKRR
jgi:hypothetical protein